jgi:Tfp pilus assembly protein PilP
MRSVLLVMTNCTPGKEEEFSTWYQEVHLKEVLEVPGFVAAQRFELTEAQMTEDERPYRFLAIYEVEGDVETAFEKLKAASSSMDMSPTLIDNFTAHYAPIGERREA